MPLRILTQLRIVTASVAFLACGSTVETTDASTDAMSDVVDASKDVTDASALPDVVKEAAPDAQPDAGGCNTLVNGSAAIDTTEETGVAPAPVGGAVAAGLYYLTAFNDYDGKTGTIALGTRTTINIAGTDLEFVEQVGQGAPTRASVTFAASAPTFTFNMTCPAVQTYSNQYTATSSTLVLYFDDGKGNTAEEVLTRQ